jgi:DNA/RNA endonuclease YhcR with UshA esterase domain
MNKIQAISHTQLFSLFVFIILTTSACLEPTPTVDIPPSPTPTIVASSSVLISEVMAGIQGNNNFEFIELYNAGDEISDLQGWSLWYKLPGDSPEQFVFRWKGSALIPPKGHLLLTRWGEDVGLPPDATFEQALNTTGGGLSLKNRENTLIDSIAWGKPIPGYGEGETAPALENGLSLERLPSGDMGNGADSDDNLSDFRLNASPLPQNTGSRPSPLGEVGLSLSLSAPETITPGAQFDYTLTLINENNRNIHGIEVRFPIPTGFEIISLPDDVTLDEETLNWSVEHLEPGGSLSLPIAVEVPWTYTTAQATNYYARADDWSGVAFGGPVYTMVEGGVIPIGTARELVGAELMVEGTATMYTGGYFAGGGNTKFYIEDDSGGLQVQVFGGEGLVNVNLGSIVQVKGTIGAYRGSIQIVPDIVPGDVETILPPNQGELWTPTRVSIQQAANDLESLPGKLVQVEGLVTRLEEFTYSYEIDLADDEGQILTLYVDKLTEIIVEKIEEGQRYTATGILEERDGTLQLYPRRQSDLTKVFPPVLMISGDAPSIVQPGVVFTSTLTVINHTADTLTNLQISAPLPNEHAIFENAYDGGVLQGEMITWAIPELGGGGEGSSVRYALRSGAADGQFPQIINQGYSVTADEWLDPVTGPALRTFIGDSVPIWAIQGEGFRSPYVLERLTTQGLVTGVFYDPDDEDSLGGFWIQESEADDDERTSDGLFVYINPRDTKGTTDIDLSIGDLIQVTGDVRELHQQTTLQVFASDEISILDRGNELPVAVELDPPESRDKANQYYEALEGELVSVPGYAISVSPTSQYGEYVIVLPYHNVHRLWQGDDNGIAIMVDDGSYAVHDDRSTLDYVVATGDQVSNLIGPLAFTFGRYKIEPIVTPEVENQLIEIEPLSPSAPDEFRIMTWNVENLFDVRAPHPSSPPRPSLEDYELDLTKIANTILESGSPVIIALQEVENLTILENLAAHELILPYHYHPFLIEGSDSRGIDVGYLIRSDRAEVLELQQFNAPQGLTSRPPLMVKVEITTDADRITLYAVNNHFTSMSGGEAATEPRRIAQAAWNVTILEEILAEDPDANVAILGDLNSYYLSPPLDTLREGGLDHVFEAWSDPRFNPYSYIYEGESQNLDHILVTPSLMSMLKYIDILHTNADYPPAIPGDPTPIRKSDHDPIIATFAHP